MKKDGNINVKLDEMGENRHFIGFLYKFSEEVRIVFSMCETNVLHSFTCFTPVGCQRVGVKLLV